MNEKILCIKREDLFYNNYFNGFVVHWKDMDKDKVFFKDRDQVERDISIKQVIPYVLILSADRKKIFCYGRKGSEQRLHNKLSFGFGGHIKEGEHTIGEAACREIKEETNLEDFKLHGLGFLNLDIDEVSQVHFGVVFIILVNDINLVKLNGDENSFAVWLDIDELETVEFESWSECLKGIIKNKDIWGSY